jgi:type III secretory pathway lipoprotein EscJ
MKQVVSNLLEVNGVRSNNPQNHAKYIARWVAIGERPNLPKIQGLITSFMQGTGYGNITLVPPSANNKLIANVLEKALRNALKYENLPPVINALKRTGAPASNYKQILQMYHKKNLGKIRQVFDILLTKKINAPQNLVKYL